MSRGVLWPGRVGAWIDSESVRAYQAVVYTAYLVAGAQNLVTGQLPTAVGKILGMGFDHVWTALLIAGPLLTFAGRRARSVAGLHLQLAGDVCVLGASATYVAAVSQAGYAGRAAFALWVVSALCVCAATMVARDVRRIRATTALITIMEQERGDERQ